MASHRPPNPLKMVLVNAAAERTLPEAGYIAPFLVYTAIRELTISTMWFGPTARLLSDGLRPLMPSKLSRSPAAGRGPGVFCSTDGAANKKRRRARNVCAYTAVHHNSRCVRNGQYESLYRSSVAESACLQC